MSVLKHIVTEVHFEAMPGCTIDECANECIEYISKYGCDIVLVFNGIYIPINKNDTAKSVISKYYLGLK